MVAKLGAAILRQPRGHVITKRLAYPGWVLPLHQPERDLGGSLRRNHGFRTLAGIAADDAVDVASRARGDLLNQQAVLFAGRDRKADRLEKPLRRQVELRPLCENVGRQILY